MERYFGVYRATVMRVELAMNRVRVQVPDLGTGEAWASICAMPGAPVSYEPGQLVFVAFEGGSPMHPIVLGAAYRHGRG